MTITTDLLALVLPQFLSVFDHFLTPQLEEIVGIGVEFETVLAVLPEINRQRVESQIFRFGDSLSVSDLYGLSLSRGGGLSQAS